MAVINIQSDDLVGLAQIPRVVAPSINRSKPRMHYFRCGSLAVAGDIGSTVDLALLPAGDVRLYLTESRIFWSAFGAARILDIGHRAYKAIDFDGSLGVQPVAAAPNLFDDDVDVSAAGNAALGSDFVLAGTIAKTQRFLSADGVMIFATVAGGTIPAGAILEGFLTYAEN